MKKVEILEIVSLILDIFSTIVEIITLIDITPFL